MSIYKLKHDTIFYVYVYIYTIERKLATTERSLKRPLNLIYLVPELMPWIRTTLFLCKYKL